VLQAIDLNRIGDEKKGASLFLVNALVVRDRVVFLIGNLRHLADLLFERHLAKQLVCEPDRLGILGSQSCRRALLLCWQIRGSKKKKGRKSKARGDRVSKGRARVTQEKHG
jgi:hypothetical protein